MFGNIVKRALMSVCAVAFVLGTAADGYADTVEVSLDEAIALAHENSKTDEQLSYKSQIAELKLKEVKANWWPKLMATGGLMYWNGSESMKVIDKDKFNVEGVIQDGISKLDESQLAMLQMFQPVAQAVLPGLQAMGNAIPDSISMRGAFTAGVGVHLVMPLTQLFQVYQGQKMAELGLKDVEFEKKGEDLKTDYEVTQVYLKLVYAQLMIDVAQEAVDTITKHVEMAQKYESVGLISHSDVLSAEVQQVKARQDLMEAKQGARLAGFKLAQVLGLPRNSEIHATDMPADTFDVKLQDLSSYQDQALQQRSELERLNLTQELGDRTAKYTLMEYMPKIMLVGNYSYIYGVDVIGSNQAFVGLMMQWTIFDGMEKYYAAQRARLEASQNASKMSEAQDLISLEVSQKYLNVETALQKTSLTQQELALADENLRTISAQFAQGESVNTDVLTAQTKRAAARADDVKAKIDVLDAFAALKLSLGEEPKISKEALQ